MSRSQPAEGRHDTAFIVGKYIMVFRFNTAHKRMFAGVMQPIMAMLSNTTNSTVCEIAAVAIEALAGHESSNAVIISAGTVVSPCKDS